MADVSNTLHLATEIIMETQLEIQSPHQLPYSLLTHAITLLPIMIAITIQLILHMKTGFTFKDSCLASLANTVSLGRATLDESQNRLVSVFYCRETWMTSIYYLILPMICITLKNIYPSEGYQIWTSYTSVALSVSHILVTKVYTKYFLHVIFPVDSDLPSDVPTLVPTVLATSSTATITAVSTRTLNSSESSINDTGIEVSAIPEEGSSRVSHSDNAAAEKPIQIRDTNTQTAREKGKKNLAHGVQKRISKRVIKDDIWVRIVGTVATITIIGATISIGFLVQPHAGKESKICFYTLLSVNTYYMMESSDPENLFCRLAPP